MGDLLSILSSSATALNAQQSVAAVASNNLDNVDTPGYSVQTANLSSSPLDVLGGSVLGGGVTVGSVTQTRDRFIEAQLPGAQGAAAYSQAQSDSLTAVDALNASTSGGLSQSLSAFWAAMQSLSQDAGNSSLRTAAIASAQQVATAFNSTASSLTQAQDGLDSEISASVSQVNTLASQMASLNQQIRVASSSGQAPNSLLDQRQSVQDQLVALTGAQPVTDAQGDVSLALPGGDALVAGYAAATLTAAPDPTNSGHIALSLTSADGSSAKSIPDASMGGQIGGWLSARDGALATAASSIDSLASDFANAVNTAHAASYGTDGSTGNNLFNVSATVPGAAASLTVNSAIVNDPSMLATAGSATAGPGDASGLATLLAVQDQSLPSSGQTPSDDLATITAQFGASTQAATSNAAQDQASLSNLNTLRASASGVSSDQELVNMQKAQSAYEAISKVITTAQTMLDALMAIQAT
jgi:flagellar hook-associated protein 1 FlgK